MEVLITDIFLVPALINIVFFMFLTPWLFIGKGKCKHPSKEPKEVCILIPTYNDAENFISALQSIESSKTIHKLNVIVIDDASEDDTKKLFEKYSKSEQSFNSLKYLNTGVNTGLKSKALSHAISEIDSSCDVVVIIDGDTILDEMALDIAIGDLYGEQGVGAVCGAVLPTDLKKKSVVSVLQYFELCGAFHGIKLAQSNFSSTGSLAGAFTVHKLEALKDVGWFNEWLVEDICWTWKARAKGWKLVYSPKSLAYTECPKSYSNLFKQRTRWSRGRVEAFKVSLEENYSRLYTILPWFIYSIVQAIWVPLFLMGTIFSLGKAAMILLMIFILHLLFAHASYKSSGIVYKFPFETVFSAVFTSILVDLALCFPNLKGLSMELFGAEKRWLTR